MKTYCLAMEKIWFHLLRIAAVSLRYSLLWHFLAKHFTFGYRNNSPPAIPIEFEYKNTLWLKMFSRLFAAKIQTSNNHVHWEYIPYSDLNIDVWNIARV